MTAATMTDDYREAVTRTTCSLANAVGLAWAMRQLVLGCDALKFDDTQTKAIASVAEVLAAELENVESLHEAEWKALGGK